MTYVSETSLTAIWHNIIQDIYIRLLLTYFLTKNFIWDIWKFGRLNFWPLTKKINWDTDSFPYECTQLA